MDELMAMLMGGANANRDAGPPTAVGGVDLETDLIDWEAVQREFGLSPEEVEELRLAPPDQGGGIRERLEGLRPNMNLGPLELTVDGSLKEPRIEGSIRF